MEPMDRYSVDRVVSKLRSVENHKLSIYERVYMCVSRVSGVCENKHIFIISHKQIKSSWSHPALFFFLVSFVCVCVQCVFQIIHKNEKMIFVTFVTVCAQKAVEITITCLYSGRLNPIFFFFLWPCCRNDKKNDRHCAYIQIHGCGKVYILRTFGDLIFHRNEKHR